VRLGTRTVRANLRGMSGRFLRVAARGQSILTKLSSLMHWCAPALTDSSSARLKTQ
jgi:hypothetical protein